MAECTELIITTDLLEMSVTNGEKTTLTAAPLTMSVTKVEDETDAAQDDVVQATDTPEETTLTVKSESLAMSVVNGEGMAVANLPLSSSATKQELITALGADDAQQTVECVSELPGAYSNGYDVGYETGKGP